jgi:nicotinate-nucleotide pyrophosphorylase (carboxylating)
MHPTATEFDNLRALLGPARREDLGSGDITSQMLPAGAQVFGQFIARQELTISGLAFLDEIARAYDGAIRTDVVAGEGERAAPHQVLASWAGPAGAILAAERVGLNFLQRLCGIATTTSAYIDAVADTAAGIYDTRKTTPGWRHLEKYAVRCGGGRNHRIGLYDAMLVKDNHLVVLAADGADRPLDHVAEALKATGDRGQFVEVEVDRLDQLDLALQMPVDVILLDNFTVEDLAEAVRRRDQAGLAEQIELEASGGITLDSVRAVAETGVERIAVGAVTHSATAVDIGFDLQPR